MKHPISGWQAELVDLYVSWIHNPLVDLWNGFVDFHNGRVERRQANSVVVSEGDDGLFAIVDGREQRIREHWFEEDIGKVLRKVMRNQEEAAEDQKCENRSS